ncbi:MAG TPA: hypothetical protein VFV38_35030, partial [Ktedonobacteraceae bacterium]|nr:hypothetical protein [Ktedonobacteraceae bacterium]
MWRTAKPELMRPDQSMLARYRVHEMRVSRKRTPGLSALRSIRSSAPSLHARHSTVKPAQKHLPSCSLLKETIFRRGLDADRGIGDSGRMVPRFSIDRWCSCSPPRACFKAIATFFSTGYSLGTL